MFGITKFHKYLYGREFVLQSDHKPLLRLLKQDRLISSMASARIKRWALTMNNYQYKLEYRPGASTSHADCPSRLPLLTHHKSAGSTSSHGIVTSDQIEKWTALDPILSQVRHLVEHGWSNQAPRELDAYCQRRAFERTARSVILWSQSDIYTEKMMSPWSPCQLPDDNRGFSRFD